MGRIPATTDEWQLYYERAARARTRFGDPFERHLRSRRLRNTILNLFVSLTFLGIAAALTALAFSLLGEL